MIKTVRSASLINYAEVARGGGLDPVAMLREFRIPPRCLRDPELTIPADAARQLLEASAQRSGIESFGLMMAEGRRLSDLGPLGLLVREQPTLRGALEAFAGHGGRLNDALTLTVEEAGDVVIFREEFIVGRGGSVRQSTELAVGVAYSMLRSYLGPNWRPRRVCFAHQRPRDLAVHDRVFGRNLVEFGHDFNGIVCSRSDLDLRNPDADPGIARMAQAMLGTDASSPQMATTTRVRNLVVQLLASGGCTIERAADHLGIDRRTIHRHLQREGTTFSAVVDSVRRQLADRYLRDRNRSVAGISALLGFAAPSSFTRWYRSAFGTSPSQGRTTGTTASETISSPRARQARRSSRRAQGAD